MHTNSSRGDRSANKATTFSSSEVCNGIVIERVGWKVTCSNNSAAETKDERD